jgi:hypothetical protein
VTGCKNEDQGRDSKFGILVSQVGSRFAVGGDTADDANGANGAK